MPVRCAVVGCGNSRKNNVHFFTLPRNEIYANKWITFAGVKVLNRSFCICSLHFANDQIWKHHPRPLLRNNAEPTLYPAKNEEYTKIATLKSTSTISMETVPKASASTESLYRENVVAHEETVENDGKLRNDGDTSLSEQQGPLKITH